MTGAGKSVIIADLLAEIGCRFGFRLIVEEGLLHAVLTQTQGCEPIIVNPNGYFILQKLPRARAVADSYFPLYLMVPSSEATKSKGPWATISPLPVTLVKRPVSGFARSRQASASSIFFFRNSCRPPGYSWDVALRGAVECSHL